MHDLWQITNMNYGGKWSLATNQICLNMVAKIIGTSTLGTGIRESIKQDGKRHD